MALLKQQLVRGVAGVAGNVFDTIITFLTDTPGTPGRDWVIHADYRNLVAPYQFPRVVLKNTGKSDNEEIYVGIYAAVQTTGLRAGIDAGICLKTYYQFDNTLMNDGTGKYFYATHFFNSIYGSGDGLNTYTHNWVPFKTDESTAVWENKPPLELWVYSNKSRIIIVINTEERFANGYAGQYIRHVTPQEVPYPLCCLSDSFNGGNVSQGEGLFYHYLTYDTVDYSSGTQGNGRFNLIFLQHGTWSFQASSVDRSWGCNRFMSPLGWSYDWYYDPTNAPTTNILLSANMNYPDGGFEQLLFPIYIYAYTASQQDYYLLGQLDGVYWAPNIRNVSLTEIGSSDCIVFPNLNRTRWYDWMALKDEL
jgi:hypothetical protein